jgi:hypothetical protein
MITACGPVRPPSQHDPGQAEFHEDCTTMRFIGTTVNAKIG